MINKEIFEFLVALKANNNREWFAVQKPRFQDLYQEFKLFAQKLEVELQKIDQIQKMHLFRIYRDVRFSKDKSPYKLNFGVSFTRQKPQLRGGYYLHIEPGNSFIACGFWNPSPEDLFRIRKEIEFNDAVLLEILEHPSFKNTFGSLEGESLKKAPKGFDPQHPTIDLIKMKQFMGIKRLTDTEICSPEITNVIMEAYHHIRPFFDYMSDALGTNLDGEPLF